MKVCPDCGQRKKNDQFYKNARKADGLQSICIPCQQDRQYKLKYGITLEERNALIDEDPHCQICRIPFEGLTASNIHTDHCHDGGQVRGILCTNCNRGLGHFQDEPELLLAAYAYLKPHKERPMTQQEKVLDYLRKKERITSATAISVLGITRLADVIFKLKQKGHSFVTEMKMGVNGSPYAEYRLG